MNRTHVWLLVIGLFFALPGGAPMAPVAQAAEVEFVETELENAMIFVDVDEESQWTVIWVDAEEVPDEPEPRELL